MIGFLGASWGDGFRALLPCFVQDGRHVRTETEFEYARRMREMKPQLVDAAMVAEENRHAAECEALRQVITEQQFKILVLEAAARVGLGYINRNLSGFAGCQARRDRNLIEKALKG